MKKYKDKKLCELAKTSCLKKEPEYYQGLVKDGRFFCLKCGRVATRKKYLCKGTRLN